MSQTNETTIKIPCRLGFPALFTPKSFAGETDPAKASYSAKLMIDRSDEGSLKLVRDAMNSAFRAQWPTNGPKLAADKVCLKDGAETDSEINAAYFLLSASTKRRPPVVNRRREPVQESDGLVYGGADAVAIVRIWAQDNAFGKRLNASLEAVQVLGTGEPFGAPPVNPNEAFDAYDDGAQSSGGHPFG